MDGRRSRRPAMASPVVIAVSLILFWSSAVRVQSQLRPAGDGLLWRRYPRTMNIDTIVKEAEKLRYPIDGYWRRFQDKIPESTQFPCGVDADGGGERGPKWRSDKRPTSVHRLRPGDVEVVGAIGDSLTSANAAREYIISVTQDRGVSFTGGGIGTWRTITTMPNILKVFNPKLVGYAVGRGDFLSYNAQLNVAITSAIDDDTLTQVKLFVKKMKLDTRIDFKNHWKVLSIFIGHNDICSMNCLDRIKHSPEAHKQQLQKALNYLYKEVPRIFVNIVTIIDPTVHVRANTGRICSFLRRIACSCLYRNDNFTQSVVDMSKLVHEYHEAEKDLVYSGIYSGREDFAVELQPFLSAMVGPTKIGDPEKTSVIEYMNTENPWTPECFHLNQRALASASIMLWNNMLEPAGNKTVKIKAMTYEDIKCPTKDAPYIFTQANSKTYFKTGQQ